MRDLLFFLLMMNNTIRKITAGIARITKISVSEIGAFFFSPLPEGLEKLLTDNHIEVDEGQLIISRQFPRSGRGTILVNGTLVPTATLRRLGEYLLDIHGQFDNSLIFNPSYHVAILDGLTADVRQARQDYDGLYRQWRYCKHCFPY